MFDIYGKAINLMLSRQTTSYQQWAEYVLFPEVGNVGVIDFKQVQACIERGYHYTAARIPEIRARLFSPRASAEAPQLSQASPDNQRMGLLRRAVKASQ